MLLEGHRALSLTAALLLAACSGDSDPQRTLRIDGLTVGGELGFRFGMPRDVDGDGELDIVAGSRRGGDNGYGEAALWSGGEVQLYWKTDELDALFGHGARAVPDLNGDGTPDIAISAPNAVVGDKAGHVDAYSGRDGTLLWRAVGADDGFGWHVEETDDLDGDGVSDLWAGAPSKPAEGRVYLVSGATGAIVRTVIGPPDGAQFGWYLVPTGDLDGDGMRDVAIGAPTEIIDGARRGAVHLVSGATGAEIRVLRGEVIDHQFGEMVAALDDVDGDGVDDLAVSAVGEGLVASSIPAEVSIISGATGARLHLLDEAEPGELYGRMLVAVPDLDGDGLRDLAIGAPWWHARDGRVEIRSTRNYGVLAEIRGDESGWLGWHIAPAGDDSMLVSQLHAQADTGAVELYQLR